MDKCCRIFQAFRREGNFLYKLRNFPTMCTVAVQASFIFGISWHKVLFTPKVCAADHKHRWYSGLTLSCFVETDKRILQTSWGKKVKKVFCACTRVRTQYHLQVWAFGSCCSLLQMPFYANVRMNLHVWEKINKKFALFVCMYGERERKYVNS